MVSFYFASEVLNMKREFQTQLYGTARYVSWGLDVLANVKNQAKLLAGEIEKGGLKVQFLDDLSDVHLSNCHGIIVD